MNTAQTVFLVVVAFLSLPAAVVAWRVVRETWWRS